MAVSKRVMTVNSTINVTPMVDVMLVLLIIFMVITPMLQKGVSVDLAKTNNPVQMPDAEKEDALLVAVTRDGKVFFVSSAGAVTIMKAGPDQEVLSVNPLDDECYATPAIAYGRLFVRTRGTLYCFGL